MHNAAKTLDPPLGRETENACSRRELIDGVIWMLQHYKAYGVGCLPFHAKVYLASMFYNYKPDYMDDFSAGELDLHKTLLENLKADSNPTPSSDLLERQQDFYVRCQKWLVDYALGAIEKVLEEEGLA